MTRRIIDMRMMMMKTMDLSHNPIYDYDYDHDLGHDNASGYDLDHW